MAGLEECEANLVVYLHPSKANCASDAILSELSSLLFTYNESFGGVVLAYDPSIRSNLAKILPGTFPCFGVQLKAKLLLFNPKPDMVLALMKRYFTYPDLCLLSKQDVLDGWIKTWMNGLKLIVLLQRGTPGMGH